MDCFDTIIPGWHTTIYPPYWLMGQCLLLLAFLQLLFISWRHWKGNSRGIDSLITILFYSIVLLMLIPLCSYFGEFFLAWYSGVEYESYSFIGFENTTWAWVVLAFQLLLPLLFIFPPVRKSYYISLGLLLWILFWRIYY